MDQHGTREAGMSRRQMLQMSALAASGAATVGFRDVRVRASQAEGEGALLIRGGHLVTADRRWNADIRIRDGKIAEIGPRLQVRGEDRVIKASGLQVLPGGIDPHAHLLPPWVDDYDVGSRGALAGGITSIGCMANAQRGETFVDALAREAARVREQSIADIFLHPILGSPSNDVRGRLSELPRTGHSDIKIFMTSPTFVQNQEAWAELIREAGRLGLITMLHCEDAQTMADAAKALTAAGQTALRYYPESRPIESEVKAVERAVALCEQSGAPIYIVHLSSKAALDVCQRARARRLPVYVETRPIYLYFTSERYQQPDGPLYVGQPPLREASDVRALWEGLASGSIDTLGTDHAPWTREQKMDPELTIAKFRPGVADLQTMLPVFYSEGVSKKKVSLERFVAVTSTNAARLFGLFPQKGTIAVGSDADLALWDPKARRRLSRADVVSRAGFSLFEGWTLTGWPTMTVRRGEVVFEHGKITALPGSGIVLSPGPTQSLGPSV
ncbi:MAG: amidohydrolase family protein [Acidobacteria bacterium]|nr:amidohydrolase family protein [Acidobacteriota bacterium]